MYEHNHQKPSWVFVKQSEVFRHERIVLLEDTVVLPGTKKKIKYLLFGSGSEAALVIVQRADGRILLETEYSYPTDKVLYQFPCGMFLPVESAVKAALRELQEETHLSALIEPIGEYYMYHRRTKAEMHVFAGWHPQAVSSATKPDETEDIKLHWLLPGEIDELIAMGQITNVDVLAPWCLYKLKVLTTI